MRDFAKYLVSVTIPTISLALLFYLAFTGYIFKIVDVICIELNDMFSFIQNENIRNTVIIVLVFLVYAGLKWIIFKFVTRMQDK